MSVQGHQRPKRSVQRGGLCLRRSETDHGLEPLPCAASCHERHWCAAERADYSIT